MKELFYWIFIVVFVAIILLIAYAISVSNLPPWFKFFLLK